MSVSFNGDAGRDRGIQRITFRKGGMVGHVIVFVIADNAYVRGDAFTLTNYMRIPAPSAAAWDGKWLSLAPSTHAAARASRQVRRDHAHRNRQPLERTRLCQRPDFCHPHPLTQR
jgi:hypothetical protein